MKIAAVHHVPRCKSVTEIMEAKVLNLGSFEQIFKTFFRRFFATVPMVGYRYRAVFHVIWLDIDFDICDHG